MFVCSVVGARPNFMKMAPVIIELQNRGIDQILVHTGQHYDTNMSQVFFDDLDIPKPDILLNIASETHTRQTAHIMIAFEEVCQKNEIDLIVVGGDVNSTLAVTLVAAKMHIPVAHVEAGLRSFDRDMPEEINRIVTDHLSTLLFTTEESANENLKHEGIDVNKCHFVGNCMVDSLMKHIELAVSRTPWKLYDLEPGKYSLLTLHRPGNVDDPNKLRHIIDIVNEVSSDIPVLFPIHPRTQKNFHKWGINISKSVIICDPLPYLAFLGLMSKSGFVLTDSGGIQEETTSLGVPCLTMRENTERPATVTNGTNRIVGTNSKKILDSIREIANGKWHSGKKPHLWDGEASFRIGKVIENWGSSF
jgi:UDP-N-acetylglucosamine 2-epimerase (non-hydrolysing)